jgi:hypothetical protein
MKVPREIYVDPAVILRFLFIFCYGYFDFGIPVSLNSQGILNFLHLLTYLLSLAISCYFLFRNSLPTPTAIRIRYRTISLGISIISVFVMINWRNFNTYLTGDELAYTGNSWNHVLATGNQIYELAPFLLDSRIEARFVVQAMNIIVLLVLLLVYKKFLQILRENIWLLALATISILKLINFTLFHFSFQYLSGYTIPINLASVFSPTDLAIRIVYFSFFILILIFGTSRKGKTDKALIVALIIALSTSTLSNSLQSIDTTIFYIAFGTVALFRLLNYHQYDIQQTIQIAAIGVFFRPANLIWVILSVVVQLQISRRALFSQKNLMSLVALTPFLSEVFFRTIKALRNPELGAAPSSVYYPEAGRVFAFLRSILDATDLTFLLLALFSGVALLLSRHLLLLSVVYFILIFTVYIQMIPHGIVGQNKYPIEVFSPFVIVSLFSLLQKMFIKFEGQKLLSLSIICFVCMFFLVLNINSKDKDFSRYDTIYSQRATYISYPLEVRLNLAEVFTLSGQKNCINPGTIYGKPYYVLRGESFVNLMELQEIRERVSDKEIFKNLIKSGELSCVMIDSISDREGVVKLLLDSGYKLAISLSGERLKTRLDVYAKVEGV